MCSPSHRPPSTAAARFYLPVSFDLILPAGAGGNSGQACLVNLRAGDTIHFPESYQSLSIYLDVKHPPDMQAPVVPNMLLAETAMDHNETTEQQVLLQADEETAAHASAQLQVTSSANDAHPKQSCADAAIESEDESDDDLDGPPSTSPPASKSHDTPPTALTIPETPGQSGAWPESRKRQHAPYSTAPEQSEADIWARTGYDASMDMFLSSPSTRRSQGLNSPRAHGLETQVSGTLLVNNINDLDTSETDSQTGLRAEKDTGASQAAFDPPGRNGEGFRPVIEQEEAQVEDQAAADDVYGQMPLTSDPRDEHATAFESAVRSVREGKRTAEGHQNAAASKQGILPQKRTLTMAAHGDYGVSDDEIEVQSKRARRVLAVNVRSDGVDSNEFERHDDEDENQVRHPKDRTNPTATASSSKPSRAAPRQDPPVSSSTLTPGIARRSARVDTAHTDDEIVVAPPVAESKAKTRKTRKAARDANGRSARQSMALAAGARRSGTPASSVLTDGDKTPRILLSSTSLSDKKNAAVLNWLRRQNVDIATDVPGKRPDFFCVVPDDRLPTTAKVLRSLALGKLVISDKWVFGSYAKRELLSPKDYVHDAIKGTASAEGVLKGRTLFFTKALKHEYGNGWDDVQRLVREAGPATCITGSAFDGDQAAHYGNTILLGSNNDDPDAAKLSHQHEQRVYSKDLLTNAITRGEVDADSDKFLLMPVKPNKTHARKR